jgi:hypothetical protein
VAVVIPFFSPTGQPRRWKLCIEWDDKQFVVALQWMAVAAMDDGAVLETMAERPTATEEKE